jgi:hypothetical protein
MFAISISNVCTLCKCLQYPFEGCAPTSFTKYIYFFHGIKFLGTKEVLKYIYCKQHNLILVTLLLESSLSPCPCIHQDVMDASKCRHSLVLHQYKVNLGQPKIKLGQRPSWVPRVGLWATKKGAILVTITLWWLKCLLVTTWFQS